MTGNRTARLLVPPGTLVLALGLALLAGSLPSPRLDERAPGAVARGPLAAPGAPSPGQAPARRPAPAASTPAAAQAAAQAASAPGPHAPSARARARSAGPTRQRPATATPAPRRQVTPGTTVLTGTSPLQGGMAGQAGPTLPLWMRRVQPSRPGASSTVSELPPAPPTPAPSASPSAVPVPAGAALNGVAAPVGDLPGWKQIFVDDFTTPAPLGTFLTSPAYKNRWTSYDGSPDTSGIGLYDPARVLSVRDGALDMFLHTENGRPLGAAPIPLFDGKWSGQTYGRFSIRFRSDALPGYGAAFLLWPNSDVWDEGEINFPEGDLDKEFWAINHCVGNAERSCLSVDTRTSFTDWHTATVEWLPGSVTFFLDGKRIGTSSQAPTTRMHLVMQAGTAGVRPDPATAGHLQIDWVSIWSPTT